MRIVVQKKFCPIERAYPAVAEQSFKNQSGNKRIFPGNARFFFHKVCKPSLAWAYP